MSEAIPRFSILVPSYNRPELIGAAVASVLANDFADFEIVISDDKSPRQAEIVAALQPYVADPRVRLHLQPVNLREPANRAFLFAAARAEWQIVLCDDDKLYPHALRAIDAAIRSDPGADLYTFGYTQIDEADRVFFSRRAPRPLRIDRAHPGLARELLVSDTLPYWLYHPATFCSHRRVREMIKPNNTIGIGDDLIFLIDYINAGGAIHVIPDYLMYYRKMSGATPGLQLNQSAGHMPNLISRAKIMLHLEARADLDPVYASYVRSAEFRRRFLYDTMVVKGVSSADLAAHVPAIAARAAEIEAYRDARSPRLHSTRLTLNRARTFVGMFGLAGLAEIAAVQKQRIQSHAS